MQGENLIARALERVKEIEKLVLRAHSDDYPKGAKYISRLALVDSSSDLCALVRALLSEQYGEPFWPGQQEALRKFAGDDQNTPALRQKPGASDPERPR